MKYLNELLVLISLGLLAYGIAELKGVPFACVILGSIILVLALFRPLLEALRGHYVLEQTAESESGDQ